MTQDTTRMGETLQDILARLGARIFEAPVDAAATPPSDADRALVVPSSPASVPSHKEDARLHVPGDLIPAEVFLETLGFFTPSSKRIRDLYTKEKIVGTRMAVDGTVQTIRTRISANHALGLPITTDLDYYRAFLKILAETQARDGRVRLPLAVPTRQLLRYATKADGVHTRREVRTFLKKMALTGLEGGIYRAKTREFTEGFVTTVFRQVVIRGEPFRRGQVAETNYVWPAAWFLANYLRGHVRQVDLTFHNRLRRPIAKALYPLLATGWYASGGQPYAKRYAALCQDFLLREERYLSKIQEKLDPAHTELQQAGFLHHWAYRQPADAQGWKVVYWPGAAWLQTQRLHEPTCQGALPPPVPASSAQTLLLKEVLHVCGDPQHTAAYRKALQTHSEAQIRLALAATHQAARVHRITKSPGAFFFDTLHRLTTREPR